MTSKRFSDGIRQVVDELRGEDELQKRITARIVGAAAQIANHHDRLIEEVAEVARHDLASIETVLGQKIYTIEMLKQQFSSLSQAKTQFGIKARGWADLVAKLNGNNAQAITAEPQPQKQAQMPQFSELAERLNRIEMQLNQLQGDVQRILAALI